MFLCMRKLNLHSVDLFYIPLHIQIVFVALGTTYNNFFIIYSVILEIDKLCQMCCLFYSEELLNNSKC